MRPIVYAPFLLAALLLGWLYLTPTPSPMQAAAPPPPEAASPVESRALTNVPMQPVPAPQQAPSLQGTQVDGILEVDSNGDLLVTEQIRHLFDYFYTTVGEVSFDQASTHIRDHLTARLPQPALDQALALLDDYIAYKTALVELEQAFPVVADIAALRARADAVQRLRASLFSAEAHQAFFGAEEVFNSFTLERLAIMHDDSIPIQDKSLMIEDLRQSLPAEMQDLLVPQIHQLLIEQTTGLQAAGADASQIRELRLSLVGPDATGRLESLDLDRQQWQRRVAEFNTERMLIANHPGLAEADKRAAVRDLAAQRFTSGEQLRIADTLDDPLAQP